MLVYIEYISRRQGVSLEEFHYAAGLQSMWTEDHGGGPPPPEHRPHLPHRARALVPGRWYTPEGGLERLGDWESTFDGARGGRPRDPVQARARRSTRQAAYEPLLEPVPCRNGLYYAEYFDLSRGAGRDDVREHFDRAA